MNKPQTPDDPRRSRLAEALRANLRRRKEQGRGRDGGAPADEAGDQDAGAASARSIAEVTSGDSGVTRVPK